MIPVLFNILFFLIPLVFFKNTSELFEFNKIVTLYSFTTIITSIWIINSIRAKKFIFKPTLFDWPLIGYLVTLLLSSLLSIDPRTSWLGYYGRFNGGLISQICYAILFWAFVSNINKKQALHTTYYILLSTAIASILAIGEHFGIFATCGLMKFKWYESCWVQDVQNRVFSSLGQPNWLAALLVSLIPLTWVKSDSLNLTSVKYYFLSILFFVTLLFTKSRSGLLAFGIGFLVFWGFVLWKEKFKHLKEFLIFLLLFSALSFSILYKSPIIVQQPTTTASPVLETGGTESGTIRKFVWLGALEVFKHHPILGTGLETFAYSFPMYKPVGHNLTSEWDFIYNKAHNEFLSYLANTGLLGFISYLSLIIYSIAIFLKLKRYEYLAGYFGILITNFFGFSVVPVSLLFFLFPALAIVTSNDDKLLVQHRKLNINQKLIILFTFIISFYLLNSIYRYWKADIYFNKSKTASDTTEIDKALQISANEPLYISQKAFLTADISLSLKALELAPYNQNIIKMLISSLVKSSDEDSENLPLKTNQILLAENVLLNSIEKSPNDPRLYYQLGILQLKINKNEKALQNLQKSIELKPNYKEARFVLGITFKALNENEKAKYEFEYILKKIDPNDELTKKYLDELNQPQK